MTTARSLFTLSVIIILFVITGQTVSAQDSTDTPDGSGVRIHIVQSGENLGDIALLYQTTPQAILQANGLTDRTEIVVGQRLIIPMLPPDIEYTGIEVVVGMEETLLSLAALHGVSPYEFGLANRVVNPATVYVGQSLSVPLTDRPGFDSPTYIDRLQTGESIWSFALRHHTIVAVSVILGEITNPMTVVPGQLVPILTDDDTGTTLPAPWASIYLHPVPLEPGRSGGVRIETTQAGTLSGEFLERPLNFISEGTMHTAVLGIDRWTAPGLYPLTLSFQNSSGDISTVDRNILIVSGGYTSEQIRLGEGESEMLNDPAIVQGEYGYLAQNMSGFTPEIHWDGLFVLPTAGVSTSAFGTVRQYTGYDLTVFHTGADLAAPTGTPIYAPASGVVVDAGFVDIRGLITIIDHGGGVYTGYWHQSSVLVNPGDTVTVGQQIGTVGNSGLSTASHLHWEMWVSGVQVDPMQWVRERFP